MCRFYRFMYSILPFKTIRSALITIHFDACENCQEIIQSEKPLKDLEAVKSWAQEEKSLWPGILSSFKKHEHAKPVPDKTSLSRPQKIWRWAASFATLTVLVVISFFIQKELKKDVPLEDVSISKSPNKVVMKRAELKGKNAKPIIYQTSTVSIIFLVED